MKKSFLRGVIGTIFFFGVFLSFANFSFAEERPGVVTNFVQGFSLGGVTGGIANAASGGSAVDTVYNAGRDALGLGSGQDNFFANAIQTIYATGLVATTKLIGWFAEGAGFIFDTALNKTTTEYDEKFGVGLFNSWKIIRDLSNIIIVFSLLYLAILTIWEGQGFAQKKILAGIILAAILINFSFFFTKNIAFDASNYIGHQILEQIKPEKGTISEGFMNIVSPQQILDNKWTGYDLAQQNEWDGLFKATGQVLLLSFIVILLAVVFLGSALTLVYRYIIFVLLIILSPFGLISSQIPFLKSYGTKWWSALKKQTLFFPAYVVCLYVILTLVSTLVTSNGAISINILDGGGVFQFMFTFILVMGFMIGLLILPGIMGAAGAEFMTNAGNFTKNKIRSLPKAGGRLALSGTARTSQFAARKFVAPALGGRNEEAVKKLQEQARGTGVRASLARAQLKAADGLKNSSLDIRNTSIGKKFGMGAGIKSWNARVSDKQKMLEERKQKEEKLLGFDNVTNSPQNRLDIGVNEAARDAQATVFKQKEIALKQLEAQAAANATANGGNITAQDAQLMAAAQQEYDEQKKKLQETELAVGKLKNKGEAEYLKLMKSRQANLLRRGKWSAAEQAALEKMEKEMKKKWQEAGKAKEKKKKGSTSSSSAGTPPPSSPSPSLGGGTP